MDVKTEIDNTVVIDTKELAKQLSGGVDSLKGSLDKFFKLGLLVKVAEAQGKQKQFEGIKKTVFFLSVGVGLVWLVRRRRNRAKRK